MLKRLFSAILASGILFSSFSAFAAADMIEINGTAVNIPTEMGSIKEMDDRTFVPVRFLTEYLNCRVYFDDTYKVATIESDAAQCSYLIQEGSTILFIISNKEESALHLQMDTAAFIDNTEERMYVPIRFLAEALGYTVGWDETTQTVTLDKI